MKNTRNPKPFAALLLALLMVLLHTAAFADTGSVTGDAPAQDIRSFSIEAVGTRAPDAIEPVYRFTISWSAVSGSYQNSETYIWNPVTLTHDLSEGSGWTELTAPSLSGTITNRSNAPVTAKITFASSEGIGVEMCSGGESLTEIILPLNSAATGTPAEMAAAAEGDPARYGTAQEIAFEAAFHVVDGFSLLKTEASRIGTATVTLTLGDVEETYTAGGEIIPFAEE